MRGIGKSYGSITALSEISFEAGKGELFGLIGPDGAGKTTLLRILATLLLPEKGQAYIAGYDIVKEYTSIRRILGYMPGQFSLYSDLSVMENIRFYARVFNTTIQDNLGVIEPIVSQLYPFKDRKAGNLSGGMKQKLALTCALVHRPEVLLLDEPTTGVDAVSRAEFWDILSFLKTTGITTLVSTPYMDEAMQCDKVALIQGGKILGVDSPRNIIRRFPHKLYAVKGEQISSLLMKLRQIPYLRSIYSFGHEIHITFQEDYEDVEKLKADMLSTGCFNISVDSLEPGIEDCFIELMQSKEK